ncbi:hypothetical protein R1flu_008747 [Riccia fluitans]|uniref:Uncharacterized protein n=1 Tax=Riccia fluitans TaxID=41844 RepID=A0ABD1YFP3_9MARC
MCSLMTGKTSVRTFPRDENKLYPSLSNSRLTSTSHWIKPSREGAISTVQKTTLQSSNVLLLCAIRSCACRSISLSRGDGGSAQLPNSIPIQSLCIRSSRR